MPRCTEHCFDSKTNARVGEDTGADTTLLTWRRIGTEPRRRVTLNDMMLPADPSFMIANFVTDAQFIG